MRSFILVAVLAVIAACNKNKPVARRLEGKWHLYQLLLNTGQYVGKDETYEFAKGAYDGKTYADWTRYTGTDTIHGKYVVSQKGVKIILRVEEPVFSADTGQVEDMDRKSLILRTKAGVFYLNKVD